MDKLEQIQSELFRQIDAQCDLTVGQVVPITEAIEKAINDAYAFGVMEMKKAAIEVINHMNKETT